MHPEASGRVGVLGAGRQALETAGYCEAAGLDVAFFAVEPGYETNAPDGSSRPVVTVADAPEWALECEVVSAVGDPTVRRRLVDAWRGPVCRGLHAPMTWVANDAALGAGTTVSPGACISRGARLGEHVIVNLGSTISHDVTIGDFVTISPGCHVAGHVSIASDVFLGIGCVILDGRSVGRGATVGAGAVVVDDVPEGVVVKGSPAR